MHTAHSIISAHKKDEGVRQSFVVALFAVVFLVVGVPYTMVVSALWSGTGCCLPRRRRRRILCRQHQC
ncbi:hypothetical protein A2U01_0081130 [Trifolium medium]|uniref:Uncharacterized protein n=1 Tax=Trifolium medium TaxID=97028 RepID=A0A392TIX6_9FABA|nr:hypothetical protein [Trifolium medium]